MTSRAEPGPAQANHGAAPPPAETGARRRFFWVPVALVVFSLLGSVVTPVILRQRERAIIREMQEVIDPARAAVSDKQTALERSISTRAAYQVSHNPAFLQRNASWTAQESQASARLRPLIARLGPATRRAYAVVGEREAVLNASNAARAGRTITAQEQFRTLPLLDTEVDAVITSLDRLDDALVQEGDQEQHRLEVLGERGWETTALLSLIGLAAILSVARLTHREQRARATAEAAVRTRDEVVSIVSHDLRNPLNTIGMAAAFLEETLPPGDVSSRQRRQAEIIGRAVRSMEHLIRDLLDTARIESGRLHVEPEALPVRPLIDDAAAILRPVVEHAGQQLHVRVADPLPPVRADRERILQILSNLVGNAVKFTPSGGVITVAAEPDGFGVRFRVSDTGEGIAPEQIPHLFDRFWQATRTDRRGIGLGLPIVKGLVEAHGGSISVDSTVGQGTTFSFIVPRAS